MTLNPKTNAEQELNTNPAELPLYVKRKRTPPDPTKCDQVFAPLPDVVSTLDLNNLTIPLPEKKSLLPFQIPAIRQMLYFHQALKMKGVYCGYDPGLGKTIMAIAMANTLKRKRILVVCPAGVRSNWEDEIRGFSTIKPLSVRTLYTARNAINVITASYCIVSYALLLKRNVYEAIIEQPWDYIILDEAKEISNIRAKRTQIVMDLWSRINKGIMLSGTPISRCTLDLFPPCHILMPEEFFSYNEFAETYCQRRNVPWGIGWEYFGGKNLAKLSSIIRSNFFVRKTKEEVLPDLPAKTYQKIVLEVGKLSYRQTTDEKRQILEAIADGKDPHKQVAPNKRAHISAKRIETALALIKEGKYFVKDYLDAGIPITVITYHHVVTDALQELFAEYKPLRLDGRTVGQKKTEVINDFNLGRSNLLFLQIESAIGINLQHRCSTAIFWEWSYDPTEINQAMDRFCRIGQKSHVNGYFLVAKDSVDEQALEIVFRKQRMIEQVIQSS